MTSNLIPGAILVLTKAARTDKEDLPCFQSPLRRGEVLVYGAPVRCSGPSRDATGILACATRKPVFHPVQGRQKAHGTNSAGALSLFIRRVFRGTIDVNGQRRRPSFVCKLMFCSGWNDHQVTSNYCLTFTVNFSQQFALY
jgi:hypothetical protein